ncbi:hypothetical protein V3C99_010030 [Haemonchus contortus]
MFIISSMLIILLVNYAIQSCEIHNQSDFVTQETLLYDKIMKDYKPKLPAISTVANNSRAGPNIPRFEVSAALSYLKLISVVEPQQKVDFIMEYRMRWNDERLKWTSSDYCGINELYLAREDVWVPKVTIVDAIATTDYREDFKKFARLNSSGSLEYFVPTVTSTACQIKIRNFPFDTQICAIKVMAQTFSARQYGIKTKSLATAYAKMGNGEWQIRNVSVRSEMVDNGEGFLIEINYFDVLMIRNPSFYVTVVITPSFIINVLCIFGLFLKADRMTKLGVALTNILSLTFILGILATVVPKTDEIPKIGVFVVVNLALMVGSLGIIVLISYVRLGGSESEQKKEKLENGSMADRSTKSTKSMRAIKGLLHILLQLANLTNFLVLVL